MRRWGRAAGVVVAALMLALTGSTAAAPRACACTCFVDSMPPAEAPGELLNHDAIFVGTPTNVTKNGYHAVYDFDVHRVYLDLASLGPNTTVDTGSDTCGLDYEIGTEVYVFADADDNGQLHVDACSPAGWDGHPNDAWLAALNETWGPPRPPAAT